MNKKFLALSFMMFASQFNATPTAQQVRAAAARAAAAIASAQVAKKGSSKSATLFAVTASTAAVGVIARTGYNAYQARFDFKETQKRMNQDIQTIKSQLQTCIDSASAIVTQKIDSADAIVTQKFEALIDATKNIDMIKAALFEPCMIMDVTKKQDDQAQKVEENYATTSESIATQIDEYYSKNN